MISMLLFQHYKRLLAKHGDEDAAETLILGAYRAMFQYMTLITLIYAVVVGYYLHIEEIAPPVVTALQWALFHFGSDGVTFLLLHSGVGTKSLVSAFAMSTAWSLVTFASVFIVSDMGYDMDAVVRSKPTGDSDKDISISLAASFSGALIFFYGTIFFAPQSYLHRRPALREYSLYWLSYNSLTMIDVLLTYATDTDWPFCIECANKYFVFSALMPFVLLRALRSDCLYWQGMYSPSPSALNAPLIGASGILRRDSVETIAEVLTDIKTVKHIPYGTVSFDDHRSFFAGASARVYKGRLTTTCGRVTKKQVVAIKMLFCMELNSKVISRFGEEVQLLNSLSDPNVLRCEGICIMPPALCMVTEYCENGSLYDFLYRHNTRNSLYDSMSWNRKLSMIIDAVRGVAYLHSKGILHGDIKSLNFLVTENLVIKLSDLGEHRVIGRDVDPEYPIPKSKNWSPPEILSGTYGPQYDTSSDVYSLGMVISELLTGRVPFDERELRRLPMDQFALHVYDGRNRPNLTRPDDRIPSAVADIVGRTWFSESNMRCEATNLLEAFLECFDHHQRVEFSSNLVETV